MFETEHDVQVNILDGQERIYQDLAIEKSPQGTEEARIANSEVKFRIQQEMDECAKHRVGWKWAEAKNIGFESYWRDDKGKVHAYNGHHQNWNEMLITGGVQHTISDFDTDDGLDDELLEDIYGVRQREPSFR